MHDDDAELIQHAGYKRLVYSETDAHVILDMYSDCVQMKRHGLWLTQALFDKHNPTELLVSNEHGLLKFDIEVAEWIQEDDSLYLRYHLKHGDDKIDTLSFECRWEPEV